MKKRAFIKLLILICMCMLIPMVNVYADGSYMEGKKEGNDAWAAALKCLTWVSDNGNIQIAYRVLNTDDTQYLQVLEMDLEGNILSQQKVDLPYYYWGGEILKGEDGCFYVAVGAESSGEEVAYCFIKYDNQWNEIARCEITGERGEGYAEIPYDGGNCDMLISKGTLIVNTSKTMPDGHQGSQIFYIDTSTMTNLHGMDAWNISHSFNQMVIKSKNKVAFLDHGDANPRALFVQSYIEPDAYTEESVSDLEFDELSVMEFNGRPGFNTTGVRVSGFYACEGSSVIVGAGCDHSQLNQDNWIEAKSNIYVIVMSENLMSYECKFLTQYDMFGEEGVTDIYSVQSGNYIHILYEVTKNKNQKQVGLMTIDAQGNVIYNQLTNQQYCCDSSVSIINNTLYWTAYESTALGTFLTGCYWRIGEEKYHAFNIDTGMESNIDELTSSIFKYAEKEIIMYEGESREVSVYAVITKGLSKEDIYSIMDSEAAVTWTLNNNLCLLQDRITKLKHGSLGDDTDRFKRTSTNITALKKGTTKLTVQLGNKKVIIPIKIKKLKVDKVQSVKLIAGKKKLTIKWKKISDVVGYQIQVSTKKNFKNAKDINVKKTKKTYIIKKLKSRRKYYVRIRAYKTYTDIDGKIHKVYSKWVKVNKKTK